MPPVYAPIEQSAATISIGFSWFRQHPCKGPPPSDGFGVGGSVHVQPQDTVQLQTSEDEIRTSENSELVLCEKSTLNKDMVCDHELKAYNLKEEDTFDAFRADKVDPSLCSQKFDNTKNKKKHLVNQEFDSGYGRTQTSPTQKPTQTASCSLGSDLPTAASQALQTRLNIPSSLTLLKDAAVSSECQSLASPEQEENESELVSCLVGPTLLPFAATTSFPQDSAIVSSQEFQVLNAPKEEVVTEEKFPSPDLPPTEASAERSKRNIHRDDNHRGIRQKDQTAMKDQQDDMPQNKSSNRSVLLNEDLHLETANPRQSELLLKGHHVGSEDELTLGFDSMQLPDNPQPKRTTSRTEHVPFGIEEEVEEEEAYVRNSPDEAVENINRIATEHSLCDPKPSHNPSLQDVVENGRTQLSSGVHPTPHSPSGINSTPHPTFCNSPHPAPHPHPSIHHTSPHPTPDIRPTPHCTPDIHTTPESTSSISSSTRSQPGGSNAPEQESSIDEGELVSSSVGPQRHLGHR